MAQFVFSDAAALARTVLIGIAAYAALIAILRVSGKRTLSKMNAFDFVVTVALGSTLATILVDTSVTLAQGALALALLVALQFAITWTSVRVAWVRRIVTGEPALLARHGRCLPDALLRARVTEEEVLAAVRGAGFAELSKAEAVVLETDGSFSVIRTN